MPRLEPHTGEYLASGEKQSSDSTLTVLGCGAYVFARSPFQQPELTPIRSRYSRCRHPLRHPFLLIRADIWALDQWHRYTFRRTSSSYTLPVHRLRHTACVCKPNQHGALTPDICLDNPPERQSQGCSRSRCRATRLQTLQSSGRVTRGRHA